MSKAASTAILTTSSSLYSIVQRLAPTLSNSSHKGECGRLGVIGGSREYTGAPFFAAMTGMKMGVDLSTVYCSVEAGVAIKSYAPDLMVRPCLYSESRPPTIEELTALTALKAKRAEKEKDKKSTPTPIKESDDHGVRSIVEEMNETTSRMDVIVIGPGLGKDALITRTVARWIVEQRRNTKDEESIIPIVIDGDGINVLLEHPDILVPRDSSVPAASSSSSSSSPPSPPPSLFSRHVLLTPNAMEFRRLWMKYMIKEGDKQTKPPEFDVTEGKDENAVKECEGAQVGIDHPFATDAAKLARVLGGVTICRKGTIDVITDGTHALISSSIGCPRRVGGQGDILSGACGTMISWTRERMHESKSRSKEKKGEALKSPVPSLLLAAFAASVFLRKLQRVTFAEHQRSLVTTNLLDSIPKVMKEMYPLEINEDGTLAPTAKL